MVYDLIKPFVLRADDSIGIVSPSDQVEKAKFPMRISRAVNALKSIGLKTVFSKHVYGDKNLMLTIEDRAKDLNEMFDNPEIKCIMSTWGGFNSNQLLEYLDFENIKRNPKIIIGYSDISLLLNAIYSKVGLITFHGPSFLVDFGEFPTTLPYTVDNFKKAVMSTIPIGTIVQPHEFTDEYLGWDVDDYKKGRKLIKAPNWEYIKKGFGEGNLIGGNVDTFNFLVGTEYFPNIDNSIFFFEDSFYNNPSEIKRLFRGLVHLKQVRVFDSLNGMIIGRINGCDRITYKYLVKGILDLTRDFDFPILSNVDIGHTEPKLTLPIGVNSKLDSENSNSFEITEAAVVK